MAIRIYTEKASIKTEEENSKDAAIANIPIGIIDSMLVEKKLIIIVQNTKLPRYFKCALLLLTINKNPLIFIL